MEAKRQCKEKELLTDNSASNKSIHMKVNRMIFILTEAKVNYCQHICITGNAKER